VSHTHQREHSDDPRNVCQAICKDLRGTCLACGKGRLFRTYLKVTCPNCSKEFFHHRADDSPPCLTILVVGRIVVSLMLLAETFWPHAPMRLRSMIWPTLTLMLSLWILS
jgi:uncharacterized protein (DUF983 family)